MKADQMAEDGRRGRKTKRTRLGHATASAQPQRLRYANTYRRARTVMVAVSVTVSVTTSTQLDSAAGVTDDSSALTTADEVGELDPASATDELGELAPASTVVEDESASPPPESVSDSSIEALSDSSSEPSSEPYSEPEPYSESDSPRSDGGADAGDGDEPSLDVSSASSSLVEELMTPASLTGSGTFTLGRGGLKSLPALAGPGKGPLLLQVLPMASHLSAHFLHKEWLTSMAFQHVLLCWKHSSLDCGGGGGERKRERRGQYGYRQEARVEAIEET